MAPPSRGGTVYIYAPVDIYGKAEVALSPFTNSGTFTETSNSPGIYVDFYVYGHGKTTIRLRVGGNIVHTSDEKGFPVDRWEFVGLTGAGGGYQILGRGAGMTDAQFPDAIQVYNTGGNKSASFPGITFTIQGPEEANHATSTFLE